jgi:hypothetical protein
MTIDASGNVGIGMTPATRTAKEQLAEWKTKAKASTWSEVTDGEFSQEPTEEALAEWMETRAAGDKLQVAGDGSFTGSNGAFAHFVRQGFYGWKVGIDNSDKFYISAESGTLVPLEISASSGNATFTGTVYFKDERAYIGTGSLGGGAGTVIGSNSGYLMLNNAFERFQPNVTGQLSLGGTSYKFKDCHLSGSVNAEKLVSVNSNSYSGGFRATRGNGTDVSLIPVGADGAVTDGTISLGRSKVDNATNPMRWKDGFFSGTVTANKFVGDGSSLTNLPQSGLPDGNWVCTGSITAAGNITAYSSSDERLKDDIAAMPIGLIDAVEPSTWKWKEDGRSSGGVIAQQLQQAGLGDWVREAPNGDLGVDSMALIGMLIAEVQDLKRRIANDS